MVPVFLLLGYLADEACKRVIRRSLQFVFVTSSEQQSDSRYPSFSRVCELLARRSCPSLDNAASPTFRTVRFVFAACNIYTGSGGTTAQSAHMCLSGLF